MGIMRVTSSISPTSVHLHRTATSKKIEVSFEDKTDLLFQEDADAVFPPMHAVVTRADGSKVTKVAVRPSVDHRSVRVRDQDGAGGTVFLGRDYRNNFIRRLNDDGKLVFSHKFSDGFGPKWIGYDGQRVYVQLGANRDYPTSTPDLYAIDPKTGIVLNDYKVGDDTLVMVHPKGGVFVHGDYKNKHLDQHLAPRWESESNTAAYKSTFLPTGQAVLHNARQGGRIEVVGEHGQQLFQCELNAYQSPVVRGRQLWMAPGWDDRTVKVFDGGTGRVTDLPTSPNTYLVLPRRAGAYVTLHNERSVSGLPAVEVRNPRGGLVSSMKFPRGAIGQVHYDRGMNEALVVLREFDNERRPYGLYRVDLTGHERRPRKLLSLDAPPHRISTRMIPAKLKDGTYLAMAPEGVYHLEGDRRTLYHNLSHAKEAIGHLDIVSQWHQEGVHQQPWEGARILEEAGNEFPYPSLPSYPSARFTHTDQCINVGIQEPGQAATAGAKSRPLQLGATAEYPDGHQLKLGYLDSYKNQYVTFGKPEESYETSLSLPEYRKVTAMATRQHAEGHQGLVGTDEGIVYWFDTEIRNASVHLQPHKFDLHSPISAIEEQPNGNFLVTAEGGQNLVINPTLHRQWSLQKLKDQREHDQARETDITFDEDGIQLGGVYLPVET